MEWVALDFIGCDRYAVNILGEIVNTKTGRYIKSSHDRDGYCLVSLYTKESGYKRPKSFKRHRLVAEAFIPNTEGHRTVDHIDGDKDNNKATNLLWASDKQNINRGHLRGQYKQRLSKEVYEGILADIAAGKTYHQIRDAYGVGVNTISKIKKNPVPYEAHYGGV